MRNTLRPRLSPQKRGSQDRTQLPPRQDVHHTRAPSAHGRLSPRKRSPLPLGLSVAAAVATLLGSMGLTTLFAEDDWLLPILLGVGCVIVGANLSRLAGLPAWMSAPTALLALLMGLTVLYSGGHAAFGILPTPGAIAALRGQFAEGVSYIGRTNVPAEPHPGLIALIVTGVGVIAIMVELCAVTLRHAAIAGYPLLILATVPMIVAEADVPWWTFATAAFGYVLLLGVSHIDATAHWGSSVWRSGPTLAARSAARTLAPEPLVTESAESSSFSRPQDSARRAIFALMSRPAYLLGLGGIIAAIAISAAVPVSSGQGLFSGFDALKDLGTGKGRSIQTAHPFTSLRGELNQANPSELLRVRTNDPEPFYLRLTSLDRFTGEGWTQSRLRAGGDAEVSNWDTDAPEKGREPVLDANVPRIRQRTEVEVRGLTDSSYLPVYANPTTISVAGDWRWDSNTETVFSARDRTAGRSYEFTSQRVPYNHALLAAAPPESRTSQLFQQHTALDGAVRPEVRELVSRLAPTGRSQIDTVRAIEQHFDESNGFRYTERTASGSSGDALVDFLANKQGFCEQYASAMAYLARAAGIPARVAVGFSRGQEVRNGEVTGSNADSYISINSRDAHAWVEVYFRGLGWVPFDPTPAAGPGRTADTSWPRQPAPDASASAPNATARADASTATPEPGTAAPSAPTENTEPTIQSGSWSERWPTLLGIGLLALVAVTLLTGPAAFRGWERRRRLRRIRSAEASESTSTDSSEAAPLALAHDVLARASLGVHAADAAEAAWQELTDTAYDLRLLPATWTRPAVIWRNSHTPRELCSKLRIEQLNKREAAAIARITAAQERNRYARDAGTVAGLHAAVRIANAALTSQAGGAGKLMAKLWPLSIAERAGRAAVEQLSVWRAAATRSAVNAERGLRYAGGRITGASRISKIARLRHADDASAAPVGRSANSGKQTPR